MKKWSVILTTTEPENYVGIIKVRQGNKNTEVLQVAIIENGLPLDLTDCTVTFQAVIDGESPVERPAKVTDDKSGIIEYIFDDYAMQSLGRQTANFTIKKGDELIGSTQDFTYFVINAVSKTPGEWGSYWQSAEDLLNDMRDYLNAGKGDFQSWFDSIKEILESVDPGGVLLSKVVDFEKIIDEKVPIGFKFVLEHDSDYQPEVKVTSYKNAIGTETGGFDSGPVFGGETIYNVPVALSYDRQKAYVEMPKSYTLSGEILVIDDGTLLVIKETQVLCFKMTGAKITKGYLFENQ
jgi:hypothetical protein